MKLSEAINDGLNISKISTLHNRQRFLILNEFMSDRFPKPSQIENLPYRFGSYDLAELIEDLNDYTSLTRSEIEDWVKLIENEVEMEWIQWKKQSHKQISTH